MSSRSAGCSEGRAARLRARMHAPGRLFWRSFAGQAGARWSWPQVKERPSETSALQTGGELGAPAASTRSERPTCSRNQHGLERRSTCGTEFRVQGQDLLETEPCEHREMTIGSQFKGRDEHGALQCDLQRCCVGQGHSSTGHAAPNQRHAAGSQRPPVIPWVGMDRAPAKRAAEELHGASGKSSQRVRMF